MKAFLILDLSITDMPQFQQYAQAIPAFITQHGGQYLIKGATTETIEGDWQPERMVLLEFPDKKHAQSFLNEPEVQPLFKLRQQTTVSQLVLCEAA